MRFKVLIWGKNKFMVKYLIKIKVLYSFSEAKIHFRERYP